MSTAPAEPLNVAWAGAPEDWDAWAPHLKRACAGLATLRRDPDPDTTEVLLFAPNGAVRDFSPFRRLRLVQSLWAGVERVAPNPTLTVPLARMVDRGLAEGMREWCLGWTLRHHLMMDAFTQDGVWRAHLTPPLAAERRVTVLGAGALGGSVAQALAQVGFDVACWSASGRPVAGVPVLAGPDLRAALARAEVLIALLPDTPATRGLLDAQRLALLPAGAVLLNPGRGTLVDEGALLTALDGGRLAHAVLDVFVTEPLPPAHPFWTHPRVTVTPHIAAQTRPATAAEVVADNLRRLLAGAEPLYLVDRGRGY